MALQRSPERKNWKTRARRDGPNPTARRQSRRQSKKGIALRNHAPATAKNSHATALRVKRSPKAMLRRLAPTIPRRRCERKNQAAVRLARIARQSGWESDTEASVIFLTELFD